MVCLSNQGDRNQNHVTCARLSWHSTCTSRAISKLVQDRIFPLPQPHEWTGQGNLIRKQKRRCGEGRHLPPCGLTLTLALRASCSLRSSHASDLFLAGCHGDPLPTSLPLEVKFVTKGDNGDVMDASQAGPSPALTFDLHVTFA